MKKIKTHFAIGFLVIQSSTLALAHEIAPVPILKPPSQARIVQKIVDVAAKSSCAQINWTGRGRAPAGYVKGMALSYARSLCRIKSSDAGTPAAKILMAASSNNSKKDILSHYQDILSRAGLRTNQSGEEPLLATYSIGMGLGMKESSGKYCEGWDAAAGSDRSSVEAEAGLFQASYNSASASPELKRLYDEYKKNPSRCFLEVFKEGVSCKPRNILGSGAGADYQAFTKACPAFATEYAMTLIRILRTHFGPLNRRTAQVVPACESMLTTVHQLVDSNSEANCRGVQ